MRTRLMRTSLLTPLLLALLFVAAGRAFGQRPTPGTLYQIIAKHSGKCLAVDGGPDAVGNGARVVQQDCNNEQNQLWLFDSVDGGNTYRITAKHSGKVLDVFGGVFSTGNGVIVEQWGYNGAGNQMWIVSDIGDGYYKILARHSGKSLDIFGASTDNGAQAHQWDFVGGDNQKWRLTPLPVRPACVGADSVTSTFNGHAHMEIDNPNTPNPFDRSLNLTADFTDCRTILRVTRFPDIPVTFPVIVFGVQLGENTTTVTMTGGGSGRRNAMTGGLEIPVTLHFQHTFPGAGSSDISLILRADRTAADGSVNLAGSGRFTGGFLGGSDCHIRVTGSFSPNP